MKSSHQELCIQVGGRNKPEASLGLGGSRQLGMGGVGKVPPGQVLCHSTTIGDTLGVPLPPSACIVPEARWPPPLRAAGTTLSPSTNACPAQTLPWVPGKSWGHCLCQPPPQGTHTVCGSRAELASHRDTNHEVNTEQLLHFNPNAPNACKCWKRKKGGKRDPKNETQLN